MIFKTPSLAALRENDFREDPYNWLRRASVRGANLMHQRNDQANFQQWYGHGILRYAQDDKACKYGGEEKRELSKANLAAIAARLLKQPLMKIREPGFAEFRFVKPSVHLWQ